MSRFYRVCVVLLLAGGAVLAQGQAAEKIIIDTDIGDDVDDAFALALAVQSPELQVLGITTTFGDTEAGRRLSTDFSARWGGRRFQCWRGTRLGRRIRCRSGGMERAGTLRSRRTGMRWSFCSSRFGNIRERSRWWRLGR